MRTELLRRWHFLYFVRLFELYIVSVVIPSVGCLGSAYLDDLDGRHLLGNLLNTHVCGGLRMV